MSSSRAFALHPSFGDGTVNATDTSAFNHVLSVQHDPAFDYNADGGVTAGNNFKFNQDLGTTLTYSPSGTFMVGPSTTAPQGQTDISSWAGGTTDMFYSGSNVIEERQAGSSGAGRQEVWGLGYVNGLIEQDTATAVDFGGVLPTSHFLQYSLDTSFNATGTLVAGAGSYDGVAIQPNGQVVVAGVSGSNLIVTRYNANGTPDTAFGTGGTVTIGETSPTFAKLALDSSGNIDVAVNSGSSVKLYQLSGANGSTDWSTALTFATGVIPQGIALESGGDILVAGDSSSGTGIYLAAVNPSTGAIDTTFGTSGYVNAPLSGAPSGLSLAFDSSGNILIAGSDGGDFSVVRLTSSGSLDTTFNTTGEAKINMGGTDMAYAVAPGPAGTIVAAGVSVQSGNNYAALIRLTSSGSLDTSFNTTGKIVGSSGSGTIRAILVQTNGEILAGGDAASGTAQEVWMFTPSGAADTAFASGGTLTANSGATVFGWAVASGPTQRIVVAGSYGGYAALAAFAPASLRLYAQQDTNYNITAMVDSNGNVVQRMVYDPYGNMTVLSATWTPQSDLFGTQVGFQGMWLDAASGLYHTLNRDLNPATGTWEERDSGYWDGSNLYQLEGGEPTCLVDPAGLAGQQATSGPATTQNAGAFDANGNARVDVAAGTFKLHLTPYHPGDKVLGFKPGNKRGAYGTVVFKPNPKTCPICKKIRLIQIARHYDAARDGYVFTTSYSTQKDVANGVEEGFTIDINRKRAVKGEPFSPYYNDSFPNDLVDDGFNNDGTEEGAQLANLWDGPGADFAGHIDLETVAVCADTGNYLGYVRWRVELAPGPQGAVTFPDLTGGDKPTGTFRNAVKLFFQTFPPKR